MDSESAEGSKMQNKESMELDEVKQLLKLGTGSIAMAATKCEAIMKKNYEEVCNFQITNKRAGPVLSSSGVL